MKFTKLFVGAFALSAMLVACDSDSASAKDTEIEELSSSSAVEIASSSSTIRNDSMSSSAIESSSSEAPQSSSSETPQSSSSETPQSSSSEATQSSSSETPQSSSSEATQSSSSETTQSSSSEATQSSSSEATQSSSSEATQSSSSADVNSSSSENELSSSSETGIIYGTMTDSRDDKTYKTVKIGEQVWMAENLNYADSVKTPSLKGKSWCYDGVAANCEKYGRLYTWAVAIDSVKLAADAENPLYCGYGKECGLAGKVQGICPEGWHLPSYDEWNTLFTAVGGRSTAGAKLKSQTGWTAYDGITNEDAFGFSALPAGNRHYYDGYYYYEGNYAFFWSSTEYNSYSAYYMYLRYSYDYAYLSYYSKLSGHSVRCVKD